MNQMKNKQKEKILKIYRKEIKELLDEQFEHVNTDWLSNKIVKATSKAIDKAVEEREKELLDLSEEFTDDFGTFDYEGYGMRILEELTNCYE